MNLKVSCDVLTSPLYFGPEERPLFGCLHTPVQIWSGVRVVLCPPLGYEGQFAYRTLRELADLISQTTGAAVLRFDYDGCGDSAGSDEDSDRVSHWLASINHAVEEIKKLAPSTGPVVLIGLRAGALLAAAVAAARTDIAGLGLWAPCASGRHFLREQRAFSSMAYLTAASQAPAVATWGEKGFEANGYVFTHETVDALEALDLKSFPTAPAERILILDRAELSTKFSIPGSWQSQEIQIEQEAVPGYAELMEPPWLSRRPEYAIARIRAWIDTFQHTEHCSAGPIHPPIASAQMDGRMNEHAGWYDATETRFGILTQPVTRGSKALILVTSTFAHRIGANRMNVAAARSLAASGIATLRIDLACIGESRHSIAKDPKPPYQLDAVDDVGEAIKFLQRRGYKEIVLGGICAGAFLAWHSAQVLSGVSELMLVNPETFVPIHYDAADHQEQSAPLNWTLRMRNEKGLAGKARIALQLMNRMVLVVGQYLRAHLPLALGRPSLAMRIVALGGRSVRTSIIFSSSDPGLIEFRRQLGPKLRQLEAAKHLRLRCIDGPDHSFTPRWASSILIEAIKQDLLKENFGVDHVTETCDVNAAQMSSKPAL